jgi:PKD repeat protein
VGSNSLTIVVADPNQPPVANLSATPTPASLGDAISFDGSGSSDPDGSIVSYAWDFDDGTTGTGVSTSHTYADTGWYQVALTVSDDDGATGVAYLSVRVDTVVSVPPALSLKLEKGILTNVGANWQSVALSYSYTNMVVITTPVLSSGSQLPVVSRIRNTGGNSFDLKLQGFGNHVPSGYAVHYLVVEAGAYTLADDGVQMEAGTFVSTQTAHNDNWVSEARTYQQAYNDPVVLGQVMSQNDPNWSVFWANGNSRDDAPSGTAFHAGKNVGEDPNTSRANETIGYVVFEAGSGQINGVGFTAGIGGDQVKGPQNNPNGYLYPPTGMLNPAVAIVSMGAGMDAIDGGWPVLFGPNPVSSNGLVLVIDEDQTASLERSHSTESLPYLVFESSSQNQLPTAVASADQTQGNLSLSVNFDGSGSSDSDGSIVAYAWDFGDGSTASGVSVSHTFGPGLFEVVLTVTDDVGGVGSNSLTIVVADPNQPPVAGFTVSPLVATVGQSVGFDASSSSDADGAIVSYAWDFDEGGNVGSGLNATYAFSDTGWYAVSLTVTDDDAASDLLVQNVRVNPATVATGVKYETGVLTNVGANWQTVSLNVSYTNMVVITTPLLTSGSQLPVVSRIDQASGTSFDLKLQGFSGNVPNGYAVHYLVVEAGAYTLADDGVQMEAGTFSSSLTAGQDNWNTEARSYQQTYSNPVVLGQVMSYNDPNWSVFWSNGSGRSDSPTPAEFHAGKNVGEDPNVSRATETLGYVVLESGNGSLNGTAFEAGVGSDIVKGLENNANGFLYPLNGLVNPEVALLSMGGGMDATDGGWPILFGNNAVSSNGLTLLIDEDQVASTERRHSTESVAFLAFEGVAPRLKKPSELSVRVFPNPFENYLHIEVEGGLTSEVGVRISNAMGQQLLQKSSSQASFTLELAHDWPAGLYVVQVEVRGVSQYFRLLKED